MFVGVPIVVVLVLAGFAVRMALFQRRGHRR
jgi:hypothetical protein